MVLDNGQIVRFLTRLDVEHSINLFLGRLNMIVLRYSFERKMVTSRPWSTAVETKKHFMPQLNKIQVERLDL